MVIKTYLFAPGSNLKVMGKAFSSGADAVIFDLEDSVVAAEKESARSQVVNFINENAVKNSIRPKIFVRINSLDTSWWKEDIIRMTNSAIDGVVLPKVESGADIKEVEEFLSGEELIPIIESAKGIVNISEILNSSERISVVAFGSLDYALDLGISITDTGEELIYPRSQLAIASKAAGKKPPIDCVYPDVNNVEGLKADAMFGKQLGLFGKLIIHPKQITPVHQVFLPSDAELLEAKEILAAYEEATAKGLGAVKVKGRMVDYPVVLKAKRILEVAAGLEK